MKYNKKGDLIAIVGVYVDDFIMAFSPCHDGQACKKQLKEMYTWGSWDIHNFKLCGVQ